MTLYFVAVLPPEAIREEIKLLKLEIAEEFGAQHALKLPAHITLQKPLKVEEANELVLLDCLDKFAKQQTTFRVNLKNFGSFAPRVLFIDVENKEPITRVFKELQKTLLKSGLIEDAESRFHPHITLATRDLEKKSFAGAWSFLKQKEYHSSFQVDKIALLKHNKKKWEIYSEFSVFS